MRTLNITNLRKDLYNIVENTVKYNDPVSVTTKSGEAIILSKDDYDGLVETLYLMSVPGLAEKLIEGRDAPEEELLSYEEMFGDD